MENPVYFFLQKIGTWLLDLKYSQKFFLLLILVFFKSSIGIEFVNIKSDYLPAAMFLPKPKAYYSSSLGNLLFAKMLSINSVHSFVYLHIVIIMTVIVIIFFYIRSFIKDCDLTLLLVLTSSAFASLFNTIGKYDPFVFLGGFLLGIAQRNAVFFLGLFTMLLGNPEQTLIGLFLVYIARQAIHMKISKGTLQLGLILVILYYVLIQLWMLTNEVIGNRLTLILYFLKLSLVNFFNNPLGNIWTWLGSGWLIIFIFSLLAVSSFERKRILFALSLAASVTLITADGVRVFSLVTLPLYTAIVLAASKSALYKKNEQFMVGAYLLFWLITPQTLGGWGIPSALLEKYVLNHLERLELLTISVGKIIFNVFF